MFLDVAKEVGVAQPPKADLALLLLGQVDLAVGDVVLGPKGSTVQTPLAPFDVLPQTLRRLEV